MKNLLRYSFKIFFLLLFVTIAKAQSGSGWEWNSTTGIANVFRGVRDIVTDASGNVYAAGNYNDSITIGSTTLTGTPNAYNHALIIKYDKNGNVIWVSQYKNGAGGVTQFAGVVAVDASGNVYIGGTDNGTAGGVGKGFVEKYDNNGVSQWNKTLLLNEVIGIDIGPDGNPIIVESVPGNRNIYKLNQADGSIAWTVLNSGSSIPVDSHQNYSTFLDSRGNVYYNLYGFGSGQEVVASTSFYNRGATFCFVSLDNNGKLRWIDSASNSQTSFPLAGYGTVLKSGKIYLTVVASTSTTGLSGTFQTPTPTSSYYELDTLGKVTYNSFNSPLSGYNGVKLTVKEDGIYSYYRLSKGGTTQAYGDYLYASPTADTTNLAVIVKYDPVTYKVVWANSLEVTGPQFNAGSIFGLDVTTAGKVIVGGSYGRSIKLGSILKTAVVRGSIPPNRSDIFVAQFDGANVAPPRITTWTGAANNMNFNDPANWNNGVPNGIKTIIPGGLPNYPNNITTSSQIGKLEIGAGATITLPLDMNIPLGILNNGAIELTEAGVFYGGFNSGQTLVTGTGKIVIKSNAVYYFGFVVLNNSLEINCSGSVTSFGGTIMGSLILTNGIYNGDIILSNPNASITSTTASYVSGKITRAVNTSGSYNFPIGSTDRYSPVTLQLNAISGTQNIAVSFTNTISGSAPNTTAGGQSVTQLLNSGIWTIAPDVALTGGSYNITLAGKGFTNSVTDARRYIVLKRVNSSGAWGFFGNNGTASQTSTVITATAGSITGFSDFAIGIAAAAVPSNTVTSDYFRTKASGNWNDVNTWESSSDNITWQAATLTPDFNSNTIIIRSPNTVTLTANVTTDQTVVNSGGAISINNTDTLFVNDGAGFDIIVNGSVTVQSGGSITLRSTGTGTASIGSSAGTISGNVTVERYFSNKRAWRLLGIPFSNSSQSIKAAWMEGAANAAANPSPGYGTHITTFTGDLNASDFDATKPSSSIRIYLADAFASDAFHTPNTTTNSITSNPAYFLYVRGDRSVDRTSNSASSATTLRINGTVRQGNVTAGITGINFSLIPNPYPSPIDFDAVKAITANSTINTFYVWDASLGASGNYRTVTISGSNYTSTPSGGTANADNNWRFIESGTAFFIPGNRTVDFTEATKSAGIPPSSMLRTVNGKQTELTVNLYSTTANNTINLADGVREIFDNSFASTIDNSDAKKITGFDVSLGISSNGEVLAVEQRPFPKNNDAIALKLLNTTPGNYQFEIIPNNFISGLTPYLLDNYLNIRTAIDQNSVTKINFNVTSDVASAAANRFSIEFAKPDLLVSAIKPVVTIYPNPVENGIINLQMNNMPKGIYSIRLINSAGQTILNRQINHAEGTATEKISVNKINGSYIVEVTKPGNSKSSNKIIIN